MGKSAMPLSFVRQGETVEVVEVRGSSDLLHRLENLGFVEGSKIRVAADQGGNLIVMAKGSRVAVNRSTAAHVLVR